MEQNIYKQAILDAKAIRASAIANAKTSLTEAMEPRIQEMMRLKLSEEMDSDMEEDIEEGYEEGGQNPQVNHNSASAESSEDINELDLDEILAELDGISEEDDTDQMMDEESLNEAEDEEDKPEEEEKSEEDETDEQQAEDEEDMEDMESEENVDDETKVIDITLGDLKQVLQSVMGSQTPDVGSEPAGDEDLAADQGDSDELSLDDVLAELEKAEGKKIDEKKNPKDDKSDKEKKKVEKELEEAKRVIRTLNETLKDVNLLNAKLLYVNKIFKAKSLTESEKIKVVKAFDRASNVREVKNTYVTLQESFTAKKTPIRESIGFASKPAGVAPKTNIVESDPFVNRWKKIAGIK
jgi:hypothetical protein